MYWRKNCIATCMTITYKTIYIGFIHACVYQFVTILGYIIYILINMLGHVPSNFKVWGVNNDYKKNE